MFQHTWNLKHTRVSAYLEFAYFSAYLESIVGAVVSNHEDVVVDGKEVAV